MVESIEVGIVVQDATTQMIYANGFARRLLGLGGTAPLQTSSYDTAWDAVRADGTPCPGDQHPVPIALREKRIVRDMVLGVRRTGSDRRVWLQVTAWPRLSATGEVSEVVTTFSDITDRIEALSAADHALRLSDTNYRSVINVMAEGVLVLGAEGQVLTYNHAAEAMLGAAYFKRSRHPAPEQPTPWESFDAHGAPLAGSAYPTAVALRTGEPCRGRLLQLVHRAGHKLWVRVNADPIRFSAGGVLSGVVATFADVTEERGAIEALKDERARFQLMTEAVPGVVFEQLTRRTGEEVFTYVGPGIQEIVGLPASEVMRDAQAFWRRFHPEDLTRVRAVRARSPKDGGVLDEELRVGPPGGPWRWARLRFSSPRQSPDGQVVYGLLLEVTAQHELAERLREGHRQESLGLLAAGVAHNFNNILSAIVPNLERLRTDAPEPMKGDLDDAWRAAQNASELVKQLTRLVRRDAPTALETVDGAALVNDVLALCRRTFDKRTSITASLPSTPVLVRARRTELQQVLLTLCLNARDAMEQATYPALHVALARVGAKACLAVTDTGTGMSEQTMRHLGEPFFTTREPGRGTGLGVAAALGIVREFEGELTWTSKLGEGSCFTVRMPTFATERIVPETPPPSAPARPLTGKRVLLVDDEPMVRRSLRRLLERLGIEVFEAQDGPAGLALLETRGDVDACFVDLSMPEMRGDEVLRRIRAKWATLPVFILSGFVNEPDALKDATDIIAKPFSNDAVRDALLAALKPPA